METTIENLDNKGQIISEQNISVSGGNFAQGDMTINYYESGETSPSFAEIEFQNESSYPKPTFTEDVLNKLYRKRVLIIKGNNHFDQFLFGRQIAELIVKDNDSDYKALELIQNEDDQALDGQLNKLPKNQVIVLNEIHPRHIRYDLNQIIELAENKRSYYIINSTNSEETWSNGLNQLIQQFWYEIPEADHYFKKDLLPWFIKKVKEKKIPYLNDEEINEYTNISDTKNISEIVDEVDTPQMLLMFINLIGKPTKMITDSKLTKLVSSLHQSQEQIIVKWFNNLNHKQRIIALATALFNGLFVHQYFQILNELIDKTFWRNSRDILEALDYNDLDFLTVLFRFESTEEGDLIVAKHSDTRVHIVKSAMTLYPRHIEKALLIFSEIMRESYKRKIENWELYGTKQKKSLVRHVFIEATRDIGMNNLSNIESIQLKLATSNHAFIQKIAAKSLAQYRLFEKDELLFETLIKWLKSETIKERIDLFLMDQNSNNQTTINAIKTTTISTLAYAADYDKPNQLRQEIVDYLITFSTDQDQEVQQSVANVLKKFIVHHCYQLRNEIFDHLMPNTNYSEQISEGVLKAYNIYTVEIKKVIDHWLSICMQDGYQSKENRRQKTTFRDNALIAILQTLSQIDLLTDGYSLQDLYEISSELLQTEKRKDVVLANLDFLAHLSSLDYEMAFKKIPETLASFPKRYRKYMVHSWALEFRKQRKNIPNNPFTITIDNEQYPAWYKLKDRPLTTIEEALFVWLNSDSKTAKKFATLTFLEIARTFEKHEYKAIKAYEREEQKRKIKMQNIRIAQMKKTKSNTPSMKVNKQVGLGLWIRIKIFFYLLMEDKWTKESLKEIIITFISEPYSKEDLKFVLYKWRSREKGPFSSKLAKWLGKLINNI